MLHHIIYPVLLEQSMIVKEKTSDGKTETELKYETRLATATDDHQIFPILRIFFEAR